jgi:hypothetical protein
MGSDLRQTAGTRTSVERVDLVRDGGEALRLHEYLSSCPCPEAADEVEAVQRAIVLCVLGFRNWLIEVAGREAAAWVHVVALGVEPFVEQRLLARLN